MMNNRAGRLNASDLSKLGSVDVLHVIGAFVADGAERFVVDLVLSLASKGASVGVIALSQKKDNVGQEMLRRLESAGISHACGPAVKIGMKSVKWYYSKLREMHPGIVHLHTENTELAHYLTTFIFRKNHLIFRTMHTVNRSSNWLHWYAINRNRADMSIACGNAVLEAFRSQIKGNFITIPNGVDFHWPAQNVLIKAEQQFRLGLEPDKFHFLNIGNQNGIATESAAKGHDVLINAWRDSGMSDRGACLHLIGDGNLQGQLKRLADGDNGIYFHGVHQDVHNWLLGTDCFVMPSRYEGLPIAAIEAIGTGVPAIFSDIESLMEFEGAAVIRVKKDDVRDLAEKLLLVLTRKININEDADVDYIRQKYDISGVSDRYLGAYSALLPENSDKNSSSVMT